MRIPNNLIGLAGNVLKVACKLYSLTSQRRISNIGYEVCVKQTTIAACCGLSVSTVKRCVNTLCDNGIIVNRYRVANNNGNLGCYHYTLSFYDKYFYMRNDIFSKNLASVEFKLYAVMCKLRSNDTSSFYQSLNDLCVISGIDKSDVCKIIKALVEKNLIQKQLKRTKLGDYTDNTYFVIGRYKGKLVATCTKKIEAFCYFVLETIIPRSTSFVNTFMKKFWRHNLIRGSG